jgi:dTMP kinase
MLLHIENTDLTPTTELFLYLADRAQHIDQVIKPQLDAGNIVLCDRFADSTIVYQGYGRGLDTTILQQLNEVAINGLWPELTILLDIPPELGLQRATSRNTADGLTATEGRFEAENITFHKRIREGYLSWAAQNNERIKVADASASEDDVFLSIRALLESYLKH